MTKPEALPELLALAEHWEGGCNRYVNGMCNSRRCLIRGGWKGGPVDYSFATCEEHDTAAALRSKAKDHSGGGE